MSFSNEWTEWHLTPRGWESGSERTDGPGTTLKDPPVDRALTHRWSEVQSSGYGKMHRGSEEKWKCEDADLITRLLAQYGSAPEHL
jgi:hypothetical protein